MVWAECASGLDLLSWLMPTDSPRQALGRAVRAPDYWADLVARSWSDRTGGTGAITDTRGPKEMEEKQSLRQNVLRLEGCVVYREWKGGADIWGGGSDLGKGQRHLPPPLACHPRSHRSHMKLKD